MANGRNAKVVFMPVETSGLLGSIGALKEMFTDTGETRRTSEVDAPTVPQLPQQRPPRQLATSETSLDGADKQ